jgi:2-dehydro-3-deoxyphosphogluconate aldolase/(4S)-4-hydroxy-2-oxoglutarate aldolase
MSQRCQTLAQIEQRRLVAVLRAPCSELLVRAARAIHEGGIPVIEVTLGVPGAFEALGQLAHGLAGQIVLGAGTVLDVPTARNAVSAGARFVVSPILDPEIVEATHSLDAVAIPGALTPTEIRAATRTGADLVKVFPCSAVGGPDYVRGIRAPFPDIKLVAMGGIHLENVVDYLHSGVTAVGLGAGLVDWVRLEREGDQVLIGQARRFVAAVNNGR